MDEIMSETVENIFSLFHSMKRADQILVGITGGIGSGKTTVSKLVQEAGYTVFSSDEIAREIVAGNADVKNDIIEEFGESVQASDGTINSKALAAKVFGTTPQHEVALQKLNAIVHPYVVQELYERAKEKFAAGEKCVFNESALLFEAGLEDCYDYIIVVDAPEDVRVRRVAASRDLTEEEVRRRITMQMSAAEKVKGADFVVSNAGSDEELRKAVRFILAIVPTLKAQSLE
jgi:dephospho-CoA kinase